MLSPGAWLRAVTEERHGEVDNPFVLVSRLLKGCDHKVLVGTPRKTRLICSNKRKTDKLDALRAQEEIDLYGRGEFDLLRQRLL